jgi:hypothetical protein
MIDERVIEGYLGEAEFIAKIDAQIADDVSIALYPSEFLYPIAMIYIKEKNVLIAGSVAWLTIQKSLYESKHGKKTEETTARDVPVSNLRPSAN